MFQGNVERVAKEPTVLVPSTMYFFQWLLKPHSLWSAGIVDFSRSTSCEAFSKCPRHIRYVLSVAIAWKVERLAPFTMDCISYFLSHC